MNEVEIVAKALRLGAAKEIECTIDKMVRIATNDLSTRVIGGDRFKDRLIELFKSVDQGWGTNIISEEFFKVYVEKKLNEIQATK